MTRKAHGEVRQSQIITTFGPGSILDLPKYSVIVAGLDDIQSDVSIEEPRLLAKVQRIPGLQHVTALKNPPRKTNTFGSDTTGMSAHRFPDWYITTQIPSSRDRYLVPKKFIDRQKYKDDVGNVFSVVPVRFLRACRRGHIDDIDWRGFIHHGQRDCNVPIYRFTEIGNSGDASDIVVTCSCGASRHLEEAKEPGKDTLGHCRGKRPWLGFDADEQCTEMSRLVIRNASNIYFPQVLSVISIPPKQNITLGDIVLKHLTIVGNLTDQAQLDAFRTIPLLKEDFKDYSNQDIWDCIQAIKKTGQNPQRVSLKDAEFETLFSSEDEVGQDWPAGTFYSKAIKRENWGNAPFMDSFSRMVLVHRLREVRSLVGFTRIDKLSMGIDGELEENEAVHRASLSRGNVPWVPTVENRGEGIFIGFDKDKVREWSNKPKVIERSQQLIAGMRRLYAEKEREFDESEFPGIAYYMLHSFSHMLITAVSLECGYPASSIKERIYCSRHGYGVLLYTGSPDAEGTLGGLIEAGRDIHKYIKIALEMGELCSNDPVCSQHRPDDRMSDKYLLGSACHGCLLIAETSCEMSNNYLDRSLVVPTLESLGCEFFRVE
jgi:hypothetical protein